MYTYITYVYMYNQSIVRSSDLTVAIYMLAYATGTRNSVGMRNLQ